MCATTGNGIPGSVSPIALAVGVAESLTTLPAVATLDWCDLLAERLAGVASPAMCTVVVARVAPDGQLTAQESAGAGSAGLGEFAARQAMGALRAGADRVRSLGWRPGPEQSTRGLCGVGDALIAGGWRGGPTGAMWTAAGVRGLLAGVFPLDTSGGGRSLIVQIGSTERTDAELGAAAGVLAALLPLAARRLVTALGDSSQGPGRWLTAREQQVLGELSLGKSVREIAEAVGRSPHTVHDHVKSLHRKLGASSRGELVARALGHLAAETRVPEGPAALVVATSGVGVEAKPALRAAPLRPN